MRAAPGGKEYIGFKPRCGVELAAMGDGVTVRIVNRSIAASEAAAKLLERFAELVPAEND